LQAGLQSGIPRHIQRHPKDVLLVWHFHAPQLPKMTSGGSRLCSQMMVEAEDLQANPRATCAACRNRTFLSALLLVAIQDQAAEAAVVHP